MIDLPITLRIVIGMKTLILVLKRFAALLAASFVTMIIGSVFSTQRVIRELSDIGGPVSFGDRLSMSLYDIQHFGSLYWPFITLAFIIAFLAGGGVYRLAKFGRPVIYAVAGAVAMAVMLWAMEQVFFGVPIVAGARDGFGLFLQMLAGAVGGLLFSKVTASLKHKKGGSKAANS